MTSQSPVSLPEHQNYWQVSQWAQSPSSSVRYEMARDATHLWSAQGDPSTKGLDLEPAAPAASSMSDSVATLRSELMLLARLIRTIGELPATTASGGEYKERVRRAITRLGADGEVNPAAIVMVSLQLMLARHFLLEEETDYRVWHRYARALHGAKTFVVPARFVRPAPVRRPDRPLDLEAASLALAHEI